ncbi:MAG: DNA polymerase III subunit delta' [Fibrobacteres bacterium]|nr:DNA polymerase III subunit delta' [Fibrobacterota bacterium]
MRFVISENTPFRILDQAMKSERMHHAYLLSGPEGVGKCALALHFAHAILCRSENVDERPCMTCASCRKIGAYAHPDFRFVFPFVSLDAFKKVGKEIGLKEKKGEGDEKGGWETLYMNFQAEAAKSIVSDPFHPSTIDTNFADKNREISIEQIRQITEMVQMPPSESKYMVIIVPDADLMDAAPANAFLKTLEEPPKYVRFLLITSRPNALLPTIRSRCQMLKFNVLPDQDIASFLTTRCDMTPAKANEAASLSIGSLHNAFLVQEMESNEELLEEAFEFINWLADPKLKEGLKLAAKLDSPLSVAKKRIKIVSILLREVSRIQRTGEPGAGSLSQRLRGNASRLPVNVFEKTFSKLMTLNEGIDANVNGRMLNTSFILSLANS